MALARERHLRLSDTEDVANSREETEDQTEYPYQAPDQADREPVISRIASVPALRDSDTCGETNKLLLNLPQASCAVVCDSRRRPIGLVMSGAFFIQLNAEYEPEHLYELPISRLMSLHPLAVDAGTPIGLARELAAARSSRTRADAVIGTQGGVFAGIVLPEQLLP